MPKLKIALTIKIETALSVGAGGSSGTLADKSILRDGLGQPIIPGSQVKGKTRWAIEQLLRTLGKDIPTPFEEDASRMEKKTLVKALFGTPQQRSPLRFANLCTQEKQHQIRPAVSINRKRGTADESRLFFEESTIIGIRFAHEMAISGELEDKRHAALLWAALRSIDRWGGAKSRGFGWAHVDAQVFVDGAEQSDDQLQKDLKELLEKVQQQQEHPQ
ncbi:MAG: hypothetical protein GFH27_549285n26 [Chloroflexi bacterium AL-W]|nr:hypothetical protein [Chloroflexi bacterium AL-N1]NOK65538.1 hypothetical protein [Chloroflexi bacterium AL-N10]NOK74520.1 hypothetical protein [Chloroflexi bacterium AL-N5]NOK80571.1 hypothetical protein [Chloroflexi bacterium AL-W]NOK88778.1 hypothetical protein [Chloroflexi bacterium AL-N15]